MSAEDFEICRKCGGGMERVSEVMQSPLVVSCVQCGHQESAEFQAPPPWSPEVREMEYPRVVVHRSSGSPSADELKSFRELREDLRALPVSEVFEFVSENDRVDLGSHSAEEAADLVKRAVALGLDARLESPDEWQPPICSRGSGLSNPFGLPVTVGGPEDEGVIIPFSCLLIVVGAIAGAAVIVLVSCWPR